MYALLEIREFSEQCKHILNSKEDLLYKRTLQSTSNVAPIENSAFSGNTSLTKISIPARVTHISSNAFDQLSFIDITTFVLFIPSLDDENEYIILKFYSIPEESNEQREERIIVPYDTWLD